MRGMFIHRLAALLLLWGAIATSHAQTLTTLVNFDGSNGDGPDGGSLIWGSDGLLYGATRSGGPGNSGIIFKVDLSGNLSMVYNGYSSAAAPALGLLLANDGNFYGTTSLDGIFAGGTLYRITPDGTYTVLYEFSYYDGIVPNGGLIQGADGYLYGTTNGGGSGGPTSIFKMSLAGDFTVLHTFDGNEPQNPTGGLVQTPDGNFYGTGFLGGQSGYGGIFKIAPDGTFTTVYAFTRDDGNGDNPDAALVLGADGSLYGTTGGNYTASYPGTIFKITPDGTLTTLYTFKGTDGSDPRHSALIQASDGNFYGTTNAGGAHGDGTIFSITPQGVFTKLYDFSGSDGRTPFGGLVQGPDGAFYGTTSAGGAKFRGTVFRFTVPGVGSAGGTVASNFVSRPR